MIQPDEIKKGLACCIDESGNLKCEDVCAYYNSASGCDELKADALAYIRQLEDEQCRLIEDFMDYVTNGVPNPAPFCANANERCVDGRGWCKIGSETCRGFVPKQAEPPKEG